MINALISIYQFVCRIFCGKLDRLYLDPAVPLIKNFDHQRDLNHLSLLFNKQGIRVLEIGSREVTGKSNARRLFNNADYTGFDYYSGPNVDVVGDAHKLSEYFSEKFDVIYSQAVFEHLAMPWVVAVEIAKLLKIGGMVLIETHFSFSSHERPWHFFQFSDMGLKALFSPSLGFECIEAGMSNPIVGRFSSLAEKYLQFLPVRGLYCHSSYLGRKTKEVSSFDWKDLKLDEVVGSTKYPLPRRDY